jgi:hypothetical protein
MVARERGEDTLTELESSDEEEEEEGEITPPPLFSDVVSQQVGITVGVRQLKRTRTRIGSSIGLPQQPRLAMVSPNSGGQALGQQGHPHRVSRQWSPCPRRPVLEPSCGVLLVRVWSRLLLTQLLLLLCLFLNSQGDF